MTGIKQHVQKLINKGFKIVDTKILKSGRKQLTLQGTPKQRKSIGKDRKVYHTVTFPKNVREAK